MGIHEGFSRARAQARAQFADKVSSVRERLHPKAGEMTYTGDLAVIDHLVNRTEGRNIVAIFLGGGQAGATQAGVAEVIDKCGLTDQISTYLTVSCGTAAAYGLLGGSVDQIKDIYHQENIDHKLVNWRRFKKMLDLDILEETLRNYAVNHNFLKSRKPNFYAAVTDAKTGEGIWVDIKDQQDPLRASIAAMNMPVVNAGITVELNNIRTITGERIAGPIDCVDGGLTKPLPILDAVRLLDPPPTDILVIDPMVLGHMPPIGELAGYALDAVKVRNPTVDNLKRYRERYFREVPYVKGEKPVVDRNGNRVNVLAIHPAQQTLDIFCMNPQLLKQMTATAREFTYNLLHDRRERFLARSPLLQGA